MLLEAVGNFEYARTNEGNKGDLNCFRKSNEALKGSKILFKNDKLSNRATLPKG